MNHIVIALLCLWVGAVIGILTAGILHSSASSDRDCYWQQVATVLSQWTWGACHGPSQARHDANPSDTLHRAMRHVDKAGGAS